MDDKEEVENVGPLIQMKNEGEDSSFLYEFYDHNQANRRNLTGLSGKLLSWEQPGQHEKF